MMTQKTIFSELNGFVVFDPAGLETFRDEHGNDGDILTPLTETDLGEAITADGTAIPILGVDTDDYGFVLSHGRQTYLKEVAVTSEGWVLNATGGLCVCGVGYLKNFNLQRLKEIGRVICFDVPRQWLTIDIHGGYDEDRLPVFELVYHEASVKPRFEGDMSVSYYF